MRLHNQPLTGLLNSSNVISKKGETLTPITDADVEKDKKWLILL